MEEGLIGADEGLPSLMDTHVENLAICLGVPIQPTNNLPLTREGGFWDGIVLLLQHPVSRSSPSKSCLNCSIHPTDTLPACPGKMAPIQLVFLKFNLKQKLKIQFGEVFPLDIFGTFPCPKCKNLNKSWYYIYFYLLESLLT